MGGAGLGDLFKPAPHPCQKKTRGFDFALHTHQIVALEKIRLQ